MTMLERIRHTGWQSVLTAASSSAVPIQTSRRTVATMPHAWSTGSPATATHTSVGPSRRSTKDGSHCSSSWRSSLQRRSLHFIHDFASRPGPSSYTRNVTPLDEITRLRELINRANATNSKLSKERILAEFDDLIPLLAFLYDPYTRLHVTSSTVHNYLRQRKKDDDWQNNQAPLLNLPSNRARDKTRAAALRAKQEEQAQQLVPPTLLELFQLLASRQTTGHEALAIIRAFLDRQGIIEQHEYALSGSDDPNLSTTELFRRGLLRPTALEIFYRCLDRNLKAGFGERILRQAFAYTQALSAEPESTGDGCATDEPIPFRASFEVALGRTITRSELPSLFAGTEAPSWYASRKLDGVRCLFIARMQQQHGDSDSATKWKVASIVALSRNGRPFSTLAVLEREIARMLPAYPGLAELLDSDHSPTSQQADSEAPRTATLVLDGEVCILRPPERASPSAVKQLDAILTEASNDSTEQTVVEDFAAVVGLIKRKNYTIPEPAFFPFDLLTLQEFTRWRSQSGTGTDPPKRTFSQRLDTLESLVSFVEADARSRRQPSLVRKLSQNVVSSSSEVESLLATASQRGWEGVVLRQDVPYEGKRTSAIRKFKEWKDAEYTVQGITVATMRLPIDGRFEEREAMASIQIEHRGTRVSVGSGFTPEQRVEFARHPNKIVGKVVTVEYFDESRTMATATTVARHETGSGATEEKDASEERPQDSQKSVYSLRFPRIKQIWGEERDI